MNTKLILLFAVIGSAWLSVGPLEAATFTNSYDLLNRLDKSAYSDGSSESYWYDSSGNRLSRITLAATVTADITPPSVPTNLVSLAFTPSQLSIGWDHSIDAGGAGLAGYQVYVNGLQVATTRSTNFSLSGLMPDSQYCLTVAAFDHSGNISALSSPLCLTTPVFQPPFLSPAGFTTGQFQIGIAGGTPGPYDVLVSTNLIDWLPLTNLTLPVSSPISDPASLSSPQRFYELRWSTNSAP